MFPQMLGTMSRAASHGPPQLHVQHAVQIQSMQGLSHCGHLSYYMTFLTGKQLYSSLLLPNREGCSKENFVLHFQVKARLRRRCDRQYCVPAACRLLIAARWLRLPCGRGICAE